MLFIDRIRHFFYFFGVFFITYTSTCAADVPVQTIGFELWFNTAGTISKWDVTFTPNISSPLTIPTPDTVSQCTFGITLVNSSSVTIFTFTAADGVSLATGRFIFPQDKYDPLLFWELQNKISTTLIPLMTLQASINSTTGLFSILFATGSRNVTGTIAAGNTYQGTFNITISGVSQSSQGLFAITSSRFLP